MKLEDIKWSKPVARKQILYDSTYIGEIQGAGLFLETRKENGDCWGLREVEEEHEELLFTENSFSFTRWKVF
jgi:hypothetical protein